MKSCPAPARPGPAAGDGGAVGPGGPGPGARAGRAGHTIVVIIIPTTESESLLAARFFGVKKRSKSSDILGREETPAASLCREPKHYHRPSSPCVHRSATPTRCGLSDPSGQFVVRPVPVVRPVRVVRPPGLPSSVNGRNTPAASGWKWVA